MREPRRALVLVGALTLAACTAAADDGAPAGGDASASVVAEAAAVESAAPSMPPIEPEVQELVAMVGPVSETGTVGSGCGMEDEETLPDGDWYAFIVDSSTFAVTVDVACVYGPGTDQFEAYEMSVDDPMVNHVVINDVVHERELRIAPGALAYLAAQDWQPLAASSVTTDGGHAAPDGNRGVWLQVVDGRVEAVIQPYSREVSGG